MSSAVNYSSIVILSTPDIKDTVKAKSADVTYLFSIPQVVASDDSFLGIKLLNACRFGGVSLR